MISFVSVLFLSSAEAFQSGQISAKKHKYFVETGDFMVGLNQSERAELWKIRQSYMLNKMNNTVAQSPVLKEGKGNSTECPAGTMHINSEFDCKRWAEMSGYLYGGRRPDPEFKEKLKLRPPGCWVNTFRNEKFDEEKFAYYNMDENGGLPKDHKQKHRRHVKPLCAETTTTTTTTTTGYTCWRVRASHHMSRGLCMKGIGFFGDAACTADVSSSGRMFASSTLNGRSPPQNIIGGNSNPWCTKDGDGWAFIGMEWDRNMDVKCIKIQAWYQSVPGAWWSQTVDLQKCDNRRNRYWNGDYKGPIDVRHPCTGQNKQTCHTSDTPGNNKWYNLTTSCDWPCRQQGTNCRCPGLR